MTLPPDPDEPLIEGLDISETPAFELPVPPASLRVAVLARTTRALRARRRLRRLSLAAALLLIYPCGIGTGLLLRPPAADEGGGARHAGPAEDAPAGSSILPEELRLRVWDAPPPERIRLLRMAGDAYLNERGDVPAALDCYRQVLELTPPGGAREEEPGESWLLAALKTGRRLKTP